MKNELKARVEQRNLGEFDDQVTMGCNDAMR